MRNIIYILTIFLLLTSCNENKKSTDLNRIIYNYPNNLLFDKDSTLTIINLDSLENFNDLIESLDFIVCDYKTPVIHFESNKSEYNLIPMFACSKRAPIGCYKERNVITIDTDSIIVNYFRKTSIDSLRQILRKHIVNEKKEFDFSDSPNRAFSILHVDNSFDIKKTKDILIKMAEEFNKINKDFNDSLSFHIRFDKTIFKPLKIPPPPKNERID